MLTHIDIHLLIHINKEYFYVNERNVDEINI